MNSGGGGDAPLPSPPLANGGEFLLQLLRKPPHQPQTPLQQSSTPSTATRASPSTPSPPPPQILTHDPAVAALGPSLPFPPFPSNGHERPYPPPWSHSPPVAPHNFFLRPQNPNPSWSSSPPAGFNHTHQPQYLQPNHQFLGDDIQKLGFFGTSPRPNSAHQQEPNLIFGSLPCGIQNNGGVSNENSYDNSAPGANTEGLLAKETETGLGNRRLNGLEMDLQNSIDFNRNPRANSREFRNHEQERGGRGGRGWGRQRHGGNYRAVAPSSAVRRPPPGFPSKQNSVEHSEYGSRRRSFEHNVDREKGHLGELNHRSFTSNIEDERARIMSPEHRNARGDIWDGLGLSHQLDCPGPPAGSNLHSISALDIEESQLELHGEDGEKRRYWSQDRMRRDGGPGHLELEDSGEQLMSSLVMGDELDDKSDKKQHHSSRDKDYRSDTRGQHILGQRMRNFKRQIECRSDIDRLNASFLAIYESLIPAEEEKAKQKQLLTLLEKLVGKEWPEARLYLYGSCANSFGVLKSDIDVCLAIEVADNKKSEVLLKLADILQSDNLQNVQALTRARVPIVKLMDPVTGISCDICINNLLAVVNTKLLRDYAQIDVRLRQLAFIVKHWAKSRGVNETYQGTLSSYAYVLMCIHFLQQRRPAILPCLQGMERTYAVTVDNVECAYFDRVEKLGDFGCHNRESIAQLVWAFFNYWAYCHDYANDVISVRTGSIISKRSKDWTRRIGNDRHLICIEDPFEIRHDLGRVVDKYSIKVLREEFERAAEIMQYDPNPCATLLEPYIPS
ncbi:hypothetical protein F0562_019141 [Nyssa sinensis]|uniref:RNA uridylyltransferase n=1 Tax=Nyssa sinensis TaxID=561372 RepID=A0A5J4ZE42_9ASTE|nr:hypothetical protein F0562_019141 [Nyssa sinensis]